MRKLLGVFASLLLSCLSLIAFTVPAQAAEEPSLEIKNSINSVTMIRVYNTSGSISWVLYPGQGHTFAGQSSLRVDVDPDAFGEPDVDSYYIGQEGEGYGPCHDGENSASDPPNIGPNRYVKYNSNKSGC